MLRDLLALLSHEVSEGRMLLIVPLLPCQLVTSPQQSLVRQLPLVIIDPIKGLQSCINKIVRVMS